MSKLQVRESETVETLTVGFWCQAIHKKFLKRFDTSFDIKMMMKIYAIKVIFKSHEPFQSYQLKWDSSFSAVANNPTQNI